MCVLKNSIPEMTSQSFPVACFCTPPEVKFHVFGTSKIAIDFFVLFLSVHCRDFIEQIKTNLSYKLEKLKNLKN